MSTKKPSHEEEEYFAKEDAAHRHMLAVERKAKLQADELAALKQAHWMHCPKCGFALEPIQFKGVTIDKCFHCNGTWLDAGELETVAGKESDFLNRIVAVFKR
ncbi:MAG TPA: zf-TFIIB domain-containing protein [Polyangia bacterium]|jgi:hypothetical protein|nr:zf-TFIIB domain-containing protein [Polyangia bacterium]